MTEVLMGPGAPGRYESPPGTVVTVTADLLFYNPGKPMGERDIERLLGRHPHSRLFRYLAASENGLDTGFLTKEERQAVRELEASGLVQVRKGVARLAADARRDLLHQAKGLVASESASDEGALLGARLEFIQELTRVMSLSQSVADLFRSSFATLSKVLRFDIGAAVILEQNLDAYLWHREGIENPVSDEFASEVRRILSRLLGVSFGETDLLIQANFAGTSDHPVEGNCFEHSVSTVLHQENRTAGVIVLFSSSKFSPQASGILEVLASQISIVLGSIRTAERIQNLADTDDLTGIWNKRWLRRQLPNEIERSRIYSIPLSLAMFDVDDFKLINDRFGHVIGDVLLSELCGSVRETLRPPDMFARFGGDEFAVVLPHSDLDGARAVADRIMQRARALRIFAADGQTEIQCTVSVGLAAYDPDGMTAAQLIQLADERLYESKRLGKDRVSW